MSNEFRAFSGITGRLHADGREVGWCTSVQGQETISNAKVNVLGDLYPQEIVPVDYDVSLSFGFVRIKKKSLADMGIWPVGETLDVARFKALTLTVYDEDEDRPIYTIVGVKLASKGWSIDQGGIMMTNATADAIRMYEGDIA